MKRMSIILLALLWVFSLTACSSTKTNEDSNKEQSPGQTTAQEQLGNSGGNQEETEQPNDENWGVQIYHTAANENGTQRFYINLPVYSGTECGGGHAGEQGDDILAIVLGELSGQDYKTNQISDLLPAYFDRFERVLVDHFGMGVSDYEFTLSGQMAVTVNGNEMEKFTGKLGLNCNGVSVEYGWVAYGARLETNDADVLWMVLDTSEVQTMDERIEEYADKMALTLTVGG